MNTILIILLLALPLQAANLDSLLADNRVRAGVRADDLFQPLDKPEASQLSSDELTDYRFLLANLPLSDLALMTSADLVENVKLARQAWSESGWGMKYDEAMFRQFVLPHRVSQEPFVHYRKQFLDEIGPRVKGLSMGDAILEVNHWCHEKATYRPTDGRDQDPLTTIRSGFGRCEEEMILTISALRSVGIPARQCYTPYWAHSDDNHAWVEAWADGKWYYLGACEPAQELNQAWFSGPAQRAMLVVSTAYGDYPVEAAQTEHNANVTCKPVGQTFLSVNDSLFSEVTDRNVRPTETEPVLRRYGRSTNINSTAVYGPTKELKVTVLDRKGKPAKDVRVIFSLWNYGSLMPAAGVTTDENGVATLTCGIGDWFVGATQEVKNGWFGWGGKETLMAFVQIKGEQTSATLRLDSQTPEGWMTSCEYTPPSPPLQAGGEKKLDVISAEGIARGLTSADTKQLADSLFRARLAWEDSVRETGVWKVDLPSLKFYPKGKPDTSLFAGSEFADFYRKARGNWFNIAWLGRDLSANAFFDFDSLWEVHWLNDIAAKSGDRFILVDSSIADSYGSHQYLRLFLESCSEKDLYARTGWGLMDPYYQNAMGHYLTDRSTNQFLASLDSVILRRYQQNVIAPLIDYEPSLRWRRDLISFLRENPSSINSESTLLDFIRANITLESASDRLGPPLTPAQCLELKRGTEGDIERLYIGLCRVRGIPARRNPMTNVVERWEDSTGWTQVSVLPKPKAQSLKPNGKLTIEISPADSLAAEALFMRDWALAKWEGPLADVQDLGWHQPYKAMTWPVELPEGWYLLSSGKRRDDGSAPVKIVWIEVKGGEEAIARLEFR